MRKLLTFIAVLLFAVNSWAISPALLAGVAEEAFAVIPNLVSATIDKTGDTITLVYDVAVTQGSGYNDTDLDVDCTTPNIAVTYSSGNTSDTHVYTLGSTVPYGQSCNLDFNGDSDSLESSTGGDLASITDGSVFNYSMDSLSPVWAETFEGSSSGCDNAPTVLTADSNYTTYKHEGTYSLQFTPNEEAKWQLPSTYGELWISMAISVTTFTAVATLSAFQISTQNTGGTSQYYAIIRRESSTNVWRVSAIGASVNGSSLTDTTKYFILIHVKKSVSSDGTVEIINTTDGDYTTASYVPTVSDGTNTDNQEYLRFWLNSGATSMDLWLDDIKVYTSKPTYHE